MRKIKPGYGGAHFVSSRDMLIWDEKVANAKEYINHYVSVTGDPVRACKTYAGGHYWKAPLCYDTECEACGLKHNA